MRILFQLYHAVLSYLVGVGIIWRQYILYAK